MAMNKLIALDAGHGMDTAGKRTPLFDDGTFMHEREFNNAVVQKMISLLESCGFEVLNVAESNIDVPLSTRTGLANNTVKNKYNRPADFYLSVHANADKGTWGDANGVETYVYSSLSKTSNTYKYAEILLKWLIKGTSQTNRGVKQADFHVLRETIMPAVLVECAFMDNKKEALLLKSETFRQECAEEMAQAICEIFGVSFNSMPEPQPAVRLNPIMGPPIITPEQLASFLLKSNPEPKLNCPPSELAAHFINEGKAENVRGDIAFCQALHETGWFKFGGQVLPEQNNYCGLGATNNSPVGKGAWFDTPEMGVRAQIQHLKAYASKDTLSNECIDPRFSLVTRGIAPHWEDLNGRWAVPGEIYGQTIISLFQKATKEEVTMLPVTDYDNHWAKSFIDDLMMKGILNTTTAFRPNDMATRAEVAAMISNALSYINKNCL